MRRSIFGELSAVEQEIEKVSRLYNPGSERFVEPLWRMHMDCLIYRRRLLLDRICD